MSYSASQPLAEPREGHVVVVRKAAWGSFLGNFIEWFDYASYSYLATVISRVFFPPGDAQIRLMGTFAVFALSFILRPLGALVWGSWGDKRGRRWTLSVSILMMASATVCIGLLPGYAQVGVAAPLLLLVMRMIQGFSASGEYAGAATFIAEYAPKEKRGLYVSLVPASTATGLLVGSLGVTLMHALLSSESLHAWGWRIPFLIAGPLGVVARYIRVHLEDSPVYAKMENDVKIRKDMDSSDPVKKCWVHHRRNLFVSFGVCSLNAVGFYIVLTYLPTYLDSELKFDSTLSFWASSITLAAYIGLIFISGHLSDSWGRKRMLIIACAGFVVLSVPSFLVLRHANFWGILAVELLLCLLLTINDGTLASFITESFPTRVRYTGFALSFNFANAIFGGTASFIATGLIELTDSTLAPAWYMSLVALGALGAMLASRENTGKDLAHL